jgi:hypothetical protein
MPLHHQRSRDRKIIIDEHPGLHLVWYHERIFIKPIPAYFYSSVFWKYIKEADEDVYKAAVGFMRSYCFLIQYETDFDKVCKDKPSLIPEKPGGGRLSYKEFCDFVAPFKHVGDGAVSARYHYGELRLSRINRTAMLFRGKLAYFHIYPQWGPFLTHMMAPIITIFATCTIILNSMQVALAAIQLGPSPIDSNWVPFVRVSLYFPVSVMCLIALVASVAIVGILTMGVKDLIRANRVRYRRRDDETAGEKSHGIIW